MEEVNLKLYKVGDIYTSTKSKISGVIEEIIVLNDTTVRVRLNVDGVLRWTTWKAK